MDNSGEVADLMVKESIQITEAAVKLLAGGGKNLAAFLLALSQNNKKLYGKTNMAQLIQLANQAGGPDNITAVVVQITEEELHG